MIPKKYSKFSEERVDLEDGGYILLRPPKYKDRLNKMFLCRNKMEFEHFAFFDDIQRIIAEKLEEDKKKNSKLNNLFFYDVINHLENNDIPPDAYEEYKTHEEYQKRLELITYIHKCVDGNGEEFTIDDIDDFDELDILIQKELMEKYYTILGNQVGVDLKNLSSGTDSLKKVKKLRQNKKKI